MLHDFIVVTGVALERLEQLLDSINVDELAQPWHSEQPRQLDRLGRILGSAIQKQREWKDRYQVNSEPSPEVFDGDLLEIIDDLISLRMLESLEEGQEEVQLEGEFYD